MRRRPGALCCLPALAALAAAQEDGLVLLQGGLQLRAAGAQGLPKLSFEKNLIRKALTGIDDYLDQYETLHAENAAQAAQMSNYTSLYTHQLDGFFKQRPKGSVAQLMSGMRQQVGLQATDKILQLLRDNKTVKLFDRGIHNFSVLAKTFALRSEKKISELVGFSKEPDQNRTALMVEYFRKQEHIVSHTLRAMVRALQSLLEQLPEEYHLLSRVTSEVLDRAVDSYSMTLAKEAENLARPNGNNLCDDYYMSKFNVKRTLPMIGQVLNSLPIMENKASEAAQVVDALLEKLKTASIPVLTQLQKDLRYMVRNVCGLVKEGGMPSESALAAGDGWADVQIAQ